MLVVSNVRLLLAVGLVLGSFIVATLLVVSSGDERVVSGDPVTGSDRKTIEAPIDAYDPVLAGEDTPEGYRHVLGRDQIFPVYNPTFQLPQDTDWEGDTLVIGVALAGEAKAYPVSFLDYREMVIDWIGGTPILVSW